MRTEFMWMMLAFLVSIIFTLISEIIGIVVNSPVTLWWFFPLILSSLTIFLYVLGVVGYAFVAVYR